MSDVSSIKVTVIGCGYWGKNLVRNFADLGALAAICDNDPVAASELSKRHPVPVTSFADAISGGGAPAIVIATPAESHYTLAREALRAGKHVFVEKPLALEVGQAEDLCRIADEQQCTLMVGHLLQYHPAFLKLRNLVQEGALGRLQYIYSNRLNLGKVRREENILWSFAPHDISMILALVGAEPDHVEAKGAAYLHKIVSDITVTQMSFPAGEQAHVFVSWLHPSKEQKLVVIGDGGMAIFDDGRPWASKLRLFFHKIEWIDGRPEPSKVAPENVVVDEIEPLSLECRHFLECVETRQLPRTDGREGLRVLRVLEAAQRCVDGTPMGTAGTPQRGADSAWARYPEVSIHESAYVDEPAEIGVGTKIWHFSHVLSGTKIGRDCVIGQNAMLGPDVTIGDRCKIQNNVSIYKGVTLEDGVFCGPSCVFTNVHNPRAEVERKDEFHPTRVRKGVTIGANATILCGHELGEYAFIGAGALIAGDVPAHALMAGVPARRIGWMSHAGERLGEDLVCPRSGRRYREKGPEELEEIDDD